MADQEKESISDFMARINKAYGGNVIQEGGAKSPGLQLNRFSSGILSMDVALGGGWPFSRIVLIAGEYSTGKTLKTLKAAASVMEYDHDTHLHKSRLPAGATFVPGRCLFVDVEHTFDIDWAIANGWDPKWQHVAKPEYAEQAMDIVTEAIRAGHYDLIVVDSLQAMTPTKEIEASSEDWQMGLGARLVNKAMRRWNASLAKMAQDLPQGGPTLMCLNGFRLKIGVMFGDPRTLPMGKGQEFAASIIVYTKGAKVKDDDHAEGGYGEYAGVCYKNKTYRPKCNFMYRMALKDHPDWPMGQVDNSRQLIALAKAYNLIYKDGPKYFFGTDEFKRMKDITERVEDDQAFRSLMWNSVVSTTGGSPNV